MRFGKFKDRFDAGRQLAQRLVTLDLEDPVVFALPRGGVPVGYEVARALGAPLDVLVARKIGHPMQPELGLGAIAEGGEPQLDARLLSATGMTVEDLRESAATAREELLERIEEYRGVAHRIDAQGRTAILVDDGLATGVTARAALGALARRGASRRILAVPVCSGGTAERLEGEADQVICIHAPAVFRAVGQAYQNFGQTSDEEVSALLRQARADLPVSES